MKIRADFGWVESGFPDSARLVQFGPFDGGDLVLARSCQQQNLEHGTITAAAIGSVPHCADLVVIQDAVALAIATVGRFLPASRNSFDQR
jgi:uncharacterized protein with ACT and thioredoxin-like domain